MASAASVIGNIFEPLSCVRNPLLSTRAYAHIPIICWNANMTAAAYSTLSSRFYRHERVILYFCQCFSEIRTSEY